MRLLLLLTFLLQAFFNAPTLCFEVLLFLEILFLEILFLRVEINGIVFVKFNFLVLNFSLFCLYVLYTLRMCFPVTNIFL